MCLVSNRTRSSNGPTGTLAGTPPVSEAKEGTDAMEDGEVVAVIEGPDCRSA